MAAYFIYVLQEVTDRPKLEEYWAKTVPTFAGHVVKPLAAYSAFEQLEGEPVTSAVLIEFETMAAAKAWYESAAYTEIRPLRLAGATGLSMIIEGEVIPNEFRLR